MDGLPSSMRIAQYTSASSKGLDKAIQINQVPIPTKLGVGQTLVKVSFASLNPADYKIAESIAHYAVKNTPGMDFSGTVVKTNRSDIAPNQRVFGNTASFGSLAEYIIVGDGVVPLPDTVPLDQAASIGVAALTSYQTIVPYAPKKVFINGGSGGVGSYGIQVAKSYGAHVVVSCSTKNVQLCKELGADEVIDYHTQDLLAELRQHQFDLVVDNVFTSLELYWHVHEFTKPSGRYITIAGSPTFGTLWAFAKAYLIPSWLGGGKRPFSFLNLSVNRKDLSAVGQLMAEGKIRAVIDQTFLLNDVGKAFTKLKLGRTRGKILIQIGDHV